MPIKARIRDFLPADAPKGQAWFALPKDERERMLAEAQPKMQAYIDQRQKEIDDKKEADKLKQRTCQICGRGIFANVGVIAHHGYQRPGWGEQTASCRGARHLPYEADHTILDQEIAFVTEVVAKEEELLRKQIAEEVTFGIEWTDHVARNANRGNPFAGFRYLRGISRDNWDAMKADPANAEAFRQAYYYSFDDLKKRTVEHQAFVVKERRRYLKHQQKRRAEWVQKEVWAEEQWLKV